MAELSTITDPNLPEPKNISTAAINSTYRADGAGSGSWIRDPHFIGHLAFDTATPAYTHSVTTSDTVLDPLLVAGHSIDFTLLTSPNIRIRYDGAENLHSFVQVSLPVKQSSGSSKDLELSIYNNGVASSVGRLIQDTTTAKWQTLNLIWDGSLATNDYLEVFIKGSATNTLSVAGMTILISGVVEQ